MDNSLTPEKQNSIIEGALYTYPVVSMPRNVTADVISRIKVIPAPRPFHLTWNDLLLGIVFSISIVAMRFSIYNLPPLVVAQIRKESILFYQHVLVNIRWLIPVLLFSLAAFLAALTIPYLRRELLK